MPHTTTSGIEPVSVEDRTDRQYSKICWVFCSSNLTILTWATRFIPHMVSHTTIIPQILGREFGTCSLWPERQGFDHSHCDFYPLLRHIPGIFVRGFRIASNLSLTIAKRNMGCEPRNAADDSGSLFFRVTSLLNPGGATI